MVGPFVCKLANFANSYTNTWHYRNDNCENWLNFFPCVRILDNGTVLSGIITLHIIN